VNWDDFIPSVLFSYRASICDSTGFSPFFMETGREPSLPMDSLFPYLRKRESTPEEYVQDITKRLDTAFERARVLQAIASERNKDRRPLQSEPTFKEGDYVLLYARDAKGSRVTTPDARGEYASLPVKLQQVYWAFPRASESGTQ